MSPLAIDSLPEPGDRYTLGEILGTGVWANVYLAVDTQLDNKKVAIKIQPYEDELRTIIEEEFRVLRDYSNHPNLPEFYGVYRKKMTNDEADEIWFILEYCEGGSAIDFIKNLQAVSKRLSEQQIAFILREIVNGVIHLHKNHTIHRDIRGSNVLLTSEGEVKLCDFGLSRNIKSELGKRSTCIGSPCWMAPEVVNSSGGQDEEEKSYGSRADVWAVGITAIELGDGVPPFMDMHPTRAMFQILRNPPPTLYRPANWSQNYNDFIAECLEKNPENRAFMVELVEHPFFTELIGPTGNDHHLSCEIKHLLGQVAANKCGKTPKEEVAVVQNFIKKFNTPREKMYVEDLAALEKLSEETIIDVLKQRLKRGDSYSFIGDVLVSLNSNELPIDFTRAFHNKYVCKSRSENTPHIFSVADSAYQNMLHHEETQQIIMAGESYSGKSTNLRHAIKHLTILGEGNKNIKERVIKAQNITQALINAGTPINPNSTRCVNQTQITFGQTGKLSGAIFLVYLLEKNRVSSTDLDQSNFHIFYYFYDYLSAKHELGTYKLDGGRDYRYLRVPETTQATKLPYCRDDISGNIKRFEEFENNLKDLDFGQDQLDSIREILSAILILGNVRFCENGNFAAIENIEEALKVASLLKLDEKKFEWALLNYCLIKNGSAEKRRHTLDEARDARDVLAATIYSRFVDWIFNLVNQKLAFGRAIFGDVHMITLTDTFGFECLHRNRIDQLLINSLNEQLQYHFNQRMFVWEMLEQEEEQIPVTVFHYFDNKPTVDYLLLKPEGLFSIIDDATKGRQTHEFIVEAINNKKSTHVQRVSSHEFSVAHYTGKITYDARDLTDKNRDFIPPEMVETLRASQNTAVKTLFTNLLSKTGNLTMAFEEQDSMTSGNKTSNKSKWGAALVVEKQKAKKLNTLSHGQYSQIHKMRTQLGVFRATCLELLKGFSVGSNSGNTHFVRCIRADIDYKPRGFQTEMVYQQLRALSILDTAAARQKGFPLRISFSEFLRRYKFLAFDFDENVDLTKDNCRLLLIRLKMEGWVIGNSKVFLKYYNVEYLSRLYETQVKKIIKVQSMMRAFLAKRNVASKFLKFRQDSIKESAEKSQDKNASDESRNEAAINIQKAYRGFKARRKYGPLLTSSGKIDENTCRFIKSFAKRWKAKSIFQVLLLYRAARYQDLVNMSQQIHIYNQAAIVGLNATNGYLILDRINPHEINPGLLGPLPPCVGKLPFQIDDIPYFDTTFMCDPLTNPVQRFGEMDSDDEIWDAPLQRTHNVSYQMVAGLQTQQPNSYMYYGEFKSKEMTRSAYTQTSLKLSEARQNNFALNHYDQNNSTNYDNKRQFVSPEPVKPSFRSEKEVPTPSERARRDSLKNIEKRQAPVRSWNNKTASQPAKINPVKELENLGRVKNINVADDNDEPPFNFQQMLRKTDHRRDSMKRSKSAQNGHLPTGPSNGYTPQQITFQNDTAHGVTAKRDFNFENKKFSNNNGSNQGKPEPTPRPRKMSFEHGPMLKNGLSLEDMGVYVQEEIQPGVILEGYAIDI